mmetsp:Transcript_7066/g.22631  ORF Transcript_7066/g.22631 Transcript_7066/m.22631 type:complete len:298 (-) Transcript_7066:185-1078(-)|eukprot:CAMPEP_0170745050 /NCGR_PEP_ID=MMETSP0437-20130122/8097_1 /TAXON_ID=0 /ORGANISM="Sexangularia sp." /LENGTH=297 /DNA_ID=CAMNT_0011083765 /DNA_START=30 /DNA_END=923 /DNA_ORIENTATION=-
MSRTSDPTPTPPAVLCIDLDGVIWRGSTVLPGILETLRAIRARGTTCVFITNNSGKSRAEYVKKFTTVGITEALGVTEEELATFLYTSAVGGAAEARRRGCTHVLVVGSKGLAIECEDAGLRATRLTCEPHGEGQKLPGVLKNDDVDKSMDGVVVGFDGDMCYRKMAAAYRVILGNGGVFVATNCDAAFPSEFGMAPGGGAFVAAIAHATGVEPFVGGKPSLGLLLTAAADHGFEPASAVMVGDRLDTDIAMGKAAGMRTVLVLSGVTSEEQAREVTDDTAPDFVMNSFADLNEWYK